MGIFTNFLVHKPAPMHDVGFRILVFGPAVLDMQAQDDPAGALAALTRAAGRLDYPKGFSPERVHAAASEMSRLIRIEGRAGIADRVRTELPAGDRADAMRLALAAALEGAYGRGGEDWRGGGDWPELDTAAARRLSVLATGIGLSRGAFNAIAGAVRDVGGDPA